VILHELSLGLAAEGWVGWAWATTCNGLRSRPETDESRSREFRPGWSRNRELSVEYLEWYGLRL